jgi:hypothetical protein
MALDEKGQALISQVFLPSVDDLPPDFPETYRPPVNELPDSYFYGFLHGRYREQKDLMLKLNNMGIPVQLPAAYQKSKVEFEMILQSKRDQQQLH